MAQMAVKGISSAEFNNGPVPKANSSAIHPAAIAKKD
jgi:hypothetical protein